MIMLTNIDLPHPCPGLYDERMSARAPKRRGRASSASLTLAAWIVLGGCVPSHSSPAPESRRAYVEAHPELSAEIRRAILGGRVIVGMNAPEVRAAWGPPSGIHPDARRTSGFDEQWVYALREHRTPTGQRVWSLSFRDGIVVCIHAWMA